MNRVVFILSVLVVSACNCEARSSARRAPTPAPAAPVVEAPEPRAPEAIETPPPAPPGPRVDSAHYALEMLTIGNRYAMSRAGKLAVELRAAEGYTIHADYPVRVDVRAPAGVGIEKTTYERADAASFNDRVGRFEVAMRPTQTGEANIDATVRFAICQGTTCEPQEEHLMLGITVE